MKTIKLLCIIQLLFFSIVSCTQNTRIKGDNTNKDIAFQKKHEKYDTKIRLFTGNTIKFSDNLKIKLIDFSHKITSEGGASPAYAHLEFSKKNEIDTLRLLRVSYEDEQHDDFETRHWKNYKIELKALNYFHYVDIIVSKIKE